MEAPKGQSGATLVTILGGIELILIALVGYFLSKLVGTTDTSNDLVKNILPVTGILGGIVLFHTGMWYMYFTYNPLSMNLYFLLATSMCMIVSLTALSIAMVNKS